MSTPDPTGAVHPLAVGDMLGQYKLVELIAIGGMGLVYRAYDPSLERYVAIKVLAPELASDPEIAQRFLTEARAAAALNHPNVVHVYTAGNQAGIVYFVMELVAGQQIEALLTQQQQLPVREAVEFIRQAALGLQHAHQHGLIHGDVKPANFLVSESGAVKVTDFGLVQRVKAKAGPATETLYGTPGYISPEAIAGQPTDHRSDIYSLGATLFHMLAGQPPFIGATPEQTLRLHAQAPVPSIQTFNPNVPPALAQIIGRMLAKDPAARYQTYAELLQTLDRYLDERRLAGPRPLLHGSGPKSTPAAAPLPPPRRESPLGLIFTLISVIVCGLIVFLVYRTQFASQHPVVVAPAQPKSVVAAPAAPVAADRESQAAQEYKTVKAAADAAVAAGQLGRADEIYTQQWGSDRHAGTLANQAVRVERVRLRSTAGQQWHLAQMEVKKLQSAGKIPAAIAVCDHQLNACTGFADLAEEIAGLRHKLEQEAQAKSQAAAATTAAAVAAEEAAAAQARQARLQKLQVELPGLITGLQWDKGRQIALAALAESNDASLRQEINRWQNEFDWLLALRTGLSIRLKTSPSAPITLTTKRGDLKGQVTSFDPDRITLRQTFGEAGFAELTVAWNELTAASICRLFREGLDPNQPDEVAGYAVFLAEQALTKQAHLDDARKTWQAVVARDPSRTAVAQRYLDRLAEQDQQEQAVAAQIATARQREVEALALWNQLQTAASQNQWPKVAETLTTLTNDFANTEFVKSHTNEFVKISQLIVQSIVAKGFIPLEFGEACNAVFFEHGTAAGTKNGFRPGTLIGDLPENGQVLLHDTEPGGVFQLRMEDKPDAIGITWATGRFPTTATVKLPPQQQRRYSQVAVLSASSVGGATISVRLTYDTGDPEELKFKTFDWNNNHPPAAANIALPVVAVTPSSRNPGQLYFNLIETDKQRRLISLTFTWISASTEHPQHAVGIFAISGLLVDR